MQPLGQLLRMMTPQRRLQLLATLLLMVAGVLAEMLTIGAVLPFLALAADPDSALLPAAMREGLVVIGGDALAGAAILLIVTALSAAALRLLLSWAAQSLIMKLGHDLGAALFGGMVRQSYAQVVCRNSSDYLAGLDKVQAVIFQVLHPLLQAFIGAFYALFITVLLFVIDAVAAAAGVALVGLLYWAMSRLAGARLRRNARTLARASNARIRAVQEAAGGMRDIILNQSQPLVEARFAALDRRYRRAAAVNSFISTSSRHVVEGVGIAALALVTLAVAGRAGGVAGALPVLGAMALGAQRLLPLLQQMWLGWSLGRGNADALAEVVALAAAVPPAGEPASGEPLRMQNMLEFDRVSFSYGDRPRAIQAASFTIRRGERVGIVGPTGSGKSTLVDLMMGLIAADAGEIRVDGHLLDAAGRAAWHRNIAHVPQHLFLIDDTIAANIAFDHADAIDRARLEAAARAAQLETFIASLPLGLETPVGERGIRLSGGQRQRIGIARALYRRAGLLVLDEATSALDEATEAAVIAALTAAAPSATVVIVAHRSSSLGCCNRILRIEAGRVEVAAAPAGRAAQAS